MKNESYHQEFTRILEAIQPHQRIAETFQDFCRCAAIALAQPFYNNADWEHEYLRIIRKYSSEQAKRLAKLLFIAVMALEENPKQDFLGEIFSQCGISSSYKGQFFTPYSVASMMAQISFSEHEKIIQKRGYISVCEPCCGSGVMIIALRNVMIERGYNPSTQMLVTCTDIDPLCCDMAYIQLTLLGLATNVIHGDTLSMTVHRSTLTPIYFLNDWEQRCTRGDFAEKLINVMKSASFQTSDSLPAEALTQQAKFNDNATVQNLPSCRVRRGQEGQLLLW